MSTRITPYLCVRDAARALDFYREAFGAVETLRIAEPGGRIGHAEIEIDGAGVMLSDEYPDMGVQSPQALGGSPVTLHVYLDDVDTIFARALAAGGKELRPVADQFYGDRGGKLEDPFGHVWWVATETDLAI
jgi:PhnB protein